MTKAELKAFLNDRLPENPYWKKEGRNALSIQESKEYIRHIYRNHEKHQKNSKMENKI